MNKGYLISIPIGCAALAALAATGAEISIQLPVETAKYKEGKGIELAQSNCMTCHSAEYVIYQPPMPRKFWEAEVKKMQQKYGAPISDDSISALADYLTSAYGKAEPGKP